MLILRIKCVKLKIYVVKLMIQFGSFVYIVYSSLIFTPLLREINKCVKFNSIVIFNENIIKNFVYCSYIVTALNNVFLSKA